MMMGDLVLTEDEVNPVMSVVLNNGLDVTALHNHFFYETPRMFYMHVHGHGTPADIASGSLPRWLSSATHLRLGLPQYTKPIEGKLDVARLAKIAGQEANRRGLFTRSRLAVPTFRSKKWGQPSTLVWDSTPGLRSTAVMRMRWLLATSRCARTK